MHSSVSLWFGIRVSIQKLLLTALGINTVVVMTDTEENLEDAFSGESQARNKYAFYAEKAEEEGKPGVAKLFRAASHAERVHAKNHLQALGKINSTEENLEDAAEGERYEHEEMYPEFIDEAKEDDDQEALKTFNYANEVEKKHEGFYKKAFEELRESGDLEEKDWYVCEVCGNTFEGEAPEKCPICGTTRDNFTEIE